MEYDVRTYCAYVPLGSRPAPKASVHRVGWGFISLYALAYIGTSLVFLAPLLVSLALKINSLVPRI